jgi:6,7-dimethyl-8-ribityllumazine synthase
VVPPIAAVAVPPVAAVAIPLVIVAGAAAVIPAVALVTLIKGTLEAFKLVTTTVALLQVMNFGLAKKLPVLSLLTAIRIWALQLLLS